MNGLIKSNLLNEDIFNILYKFCYEDINCDLVLISEDNKRFNVHAFVTVTGIPKIGLELLHPPLRCLLHPNNEYRVRNVKGRELGLIVQYAYLNRCDLEVLDSAATIELLKAALCLQMTELYTYCLNTLEKNMDVSTALMLLERYHNNLYFKEANEMATLFLLSHLTTDQSGVFNQINAELLQSLILDDRLCTQYEESVWNTIVRWIHHNAQDRSHLVPKLLQALRIGLLHPNYLSELKNHQLVSENISAMEVLNTMHMEIKAVYRSCTFFSSITLPLALRPRLPHHVILASGGQSISYLTGASSIIRTFEAYDHHAERWVYVKNFQLPKYAGTNHGLEYLGQYLYLIGGFRKISISALCFDIKDLKWKQMEHLQQRRTLLATTVLDNRLYAIGGNQDKRVLNTVEVYDPCVGHWSMAASMKEKHADAGVATLNGYIYVVGGFDGSAVQRTVEFYNPHTNIWKSAASLIVPRRGLRCTAHRGHLFAIGGRGEMSVGPLNSMERFNPKTNTWQLMSPMSTARFNFGLARLDDRIFVCGGKANIGTLRSCEIYHILENKWYPMSHLNERRAGLTCSVVTDFNFSSILLKLLKIREEPKLLRSRHLARPHYWDEDVLHELPPGTGTLDPPNMGPLPMAWVQDYIADIEEEMMQEEEEAEEDVEFLVNPLHVNPIFPDNIVDVVDVEMDPDD